MARMQIMTGRAVPMETYFGKRPDPSPLRSRHDGPAPVGSRRTRGATTARDFERMVASGWAVRGDPNASP
ncbi:MAG: hypothetical protein GF400_01710 [Candidatus Eisenbacteria bacterium]|nr:hypothetical protein [Candidatus Eisenbacteria bacterium]